MVLVLKLIAGAAAGALLGFVLGRSRLCSSKACNVKANMIFSILAGAVFGAAVAWYWIHR